VLLGMDNGAMGGVGMLQTGVDGGDASSRGGGRPRSEPASGEAVADLGRNCWRGQKVLDRS
jgi:hypothetical protein